MTHQAISFPKFLEQVRKSMYTLGPKFRQDLETATGTSTLPVETRDFLYREVAGEGYLSTEDFTPKYAVLARVALQAHHTAKGIFYRQPMTEREQEGLMFDLAAVLSRYHVDISPDLHGTLHVQPGGVGPMNGGSWHPESFHITTEYNPITGATVVKKS